MKNPLTLHQRKPEEYHPMLFKADDGSELFHITKEGDFVFPPGVEVKDAARRFARWFKEAFNE